MNPNIGESKEGAPADRKNAATDYGVTPLQNASRKALCCIRKLSKQEKTGLDREIRRIAEDPNIGEKKKGGLRGVSVHKFELKTIQYLLAYLMVDGDLELVMIE